MSIAEPQKNGKSKSASDLMRCANWRIWRWLQRGRGGEAAETMLQVLLETKGTESQLMPRAESPAVVAAPVIADSHRSEMNSIATRSFAAHCGPLLRVGNFHSSFDFLNHPDASFESRRTPASLLLFQCCQYFVTQKPTSIVRDHPRCPSCEPSDLLAFAL